MSSLRFLGLVFILGQIYHYINRHNSKYLDKYLVRQHLWHLFLGKALVVTIGERQKRETFSNIVNLYNHTYVCFVV